MLQIVTKRDDPKGPILRIEPSLVPPPSKSHRVGHSNPPIRINGSTGSASTSSISTSSVPTSPAGGDPPGIVSQGSF